MSETTFGKLRISVFSDNKGSPLKNAKVTVRDTQGEIISEQFTDDSGKTEELTLPAPPRALSQSPDADVEIPYSECNITVSDKMGGSVIVLNAQIYAGEISLQNVVFPLQSNLVEVMSPAVAGGFPEKIPEAERKPLGTISGTVVLPEPIIPDYVVVHDGVPSDSTANDYTLSYSDYIKNVASSEIYSTWNREAIKANIIAISSFTLNRIYTEWYRGKGYDFTITNNTAFDQAFIYGRTIFSEISDVADEVFGTYIVRRGINQPLFSQYSDGRRVVREGWLSQWGSQELAQQGLSALQILKRYYGRDIYLTQAKKTMGLPLSFPGVLSEGASGEAVRTIQQQLNAISEKFPKLQKIAADGYFGPETTEAVKTFEEIFNMPVTGVVNYPVWYRISDVYVAVSRLAET